MAGELKCMFDGVVGQYAEGWAVGRGGEQAILSIYADNVFIGECVADRYRKDLAAAGIQSGFAHFRYALPLSLFDGGRHVISVRYKLRGIDLDGSPRNFQVAAAAVPQFVERSKWAETAMSLHRSNRFADWTVRLAARRRVAILGTYHLLPGFLTYHRYLVACLEQAGFAVLIVHATGEADSRLFDVETDNAALLVKKNLGYDFGSWAYGCYALREHWNEIDEVLFINDSNLGPLFSLPELLARVRAANKDMVGLTDSYERDSYHLQSYFLWFGPAICRSAALPLFAAQYPFVSDKEVAIDRGELFITRFMADQGFSVTAIYPYEQVAAQWLARSEAFYQGLADRAVSARHGTSAISAESQRLADTLDQLRHHIRYGIPMNPTHFFWDVLIEDFGFPFLKRELVLLNPACVPSYYRLPELLAIVPPSITDHLMEVRRRYGGRLAPFVGQPSPRADPQVLSAVSLPAPDGPARSRRITRTCQPISLSTSRPNLVS